MTVIHPVGSLDALQYEIQFDDRYRLLAQLAARKTYDDRSYRIDMPCKATAQRAIDAFYDDLYCNRSDEPQRMLESRILLHVNALCVETALLLDKINKRKATQRFARQARHTAYTSVGMRRCRNGMYE